MIRGFIILLFFQLMGDMLSTGFDLPVPGPVIGMVLLFWVLVLMGDMLSTGFDLPVPGPVIGMVLLFWVLVLMGGLPADLEKTGEALISNIGLFFVPAGAGVSLYLGLIGEQWPMILVASLTSTVLTLFLCAFIFRTLAGR